MNNPIKGDNITLSFLIVDDDQTNRLILETMLKRLGHLVNTACNGQEAVDSYAKNKQDMILMDVMMPVMDGYDACKIIKENNSDLFIPIIFITAITDDQSLSKCIECGGDDFLTKPFNNIILRAKINALARTSLLYKLINKKNEEMRAIHAQLQREHELAESIFSKISTPPATDGKSIEYLLSPQSISSGDILMYAEVNNHQYAMLGDFTGHGLSAAIGAIPTTDIFYKMAKQNAPIELIARNISQKLNEVLPTGLYCAACIVDIDNNKGTIKIINAGVPDALILLNSDSDLIYFKSTNLPLGIIAGKSNTYDIYNYNIKEDCSLYIYSDGITEANNIDNKMLGQDKFEEMVLLSRKHGGFNSITKKMKEFRSSDEQNDDITLAKIDIKVGTYSDINPSDSTNWEEELHINNEAIKSDQAIDITIDKIKEHIDSKNLPIENNIFTIVSELLSNEIDHSILAMDSSIKEGNDGFHAYKEERSKKIAEINDQFIDLSIKVEDLGLTRMLTLLLRSSGTTNYPDIDNITVNDDKPHGRGLHLLKKLCESFSINKNNKTISLIYKW